MPEPLTLMTVHAHPDDEAIGTGGVLARYADEGIRTVLVTCTGGEVGEIGDPTLATPENLADVRERELRAACAILGCDTWSCSGTVTRACSGHRTTSTQMRSRGLTWTSRRAGWSR